MRFWKLSSRIDKRYTLAAVAFLVIAAAALTWFLEYRYFINDSGATWTFFWERPAVFWYNALLMLLFVAFLTGITRRPVVAVGITWAIIIALTYVHINKYNARGFPLLPEDFALASEAASLAKFVAVWPLIKMITAILLVLVLTFLANRWVFRKFALEERWRTKKRLERWAVISRVSIVVIAVGLMLNLTSFAVNHKGQRYESIPWLNSEFVAWNQVKNYDYNGFILGFLYNMRKSEMTPPDGYSDELVVRVAEKYEKIAKEKNVGRTDLGEQDVNVVVVLNESFYDPEVELNGYRFADFYPHDGGEILPTLRAMQSRYPSGYLYTTDYGGGTANIELEALTGLTNYWANTVPYTDLIPQAGKVPSVASFLDDSGFRAVAIHPFNGSMYKRNIALGNFGYEKFITEREMKYTETEVNSEYINDRSAYLEVLDVLDESDQNQYITLITMQNHLPYHSDQYDSTAFKISDTTLSTDRRGELETYFQMLHNSDKYLGEFLAELDNSDEKTVVLFFGDHSPGIFERVNDNAVKEVRDLTRLVPYFVYSNFDISYTGSKNLPMTTPNCLSNTLFNALSAQKPWLFYLLDNVCGETPILANSWFGTEAPFVTTALSEYELVTYAMLSGRFSAWETVETLGE